MQSIKDLAAFPVVVNDKAARVVAAFVVLGAVAGASTGSAWIAAVLAVGFALRVLAGPRFSPLGRLAAHVIAPRLGPAQLVPGAPKRFAQAIGLAFTTAAAIAGFSGATTVLTALLLVLVVFATLEAALGFCAGCYVFGQLMRAGLVPERICLECADLSRRTAPAQA